MVAAPGSSGRAFRRRLFGYKAAEVDMYLTHEGEVNAARSAEVERLKAAEPLTRVGADIAALLTAFAESVATSREEANAELERTRHEAESYAEEKHTEADRVVSEARARADSLAEDLLSKARQAVAVTAEQWVTVTRALETASGGIRIALEALRGLSELPSSHVVDLSDSNNQFAKPIADLTNMPDPSARI